MAKSKSVDPEVPSRIKRWRTARAMTRLELAQKLEVSKATISNWELGMNEPDAKRFIKLADLASGKDRAWFLAKAGAIETDQSSGTPLKILSYEALNSRLLTDVIECVLSELQSRNLRLPPRKIAEIATALYEHCRGQGKVDKSVAFTLLKFA